MSPALELVRLALNPAEWLAHHFPSLNHSSPLRVVLRIQEKSRGCLEIAEEGGGLALRTVHLESWQTVMPGTFRHSYKMGLRWGGQVPDRGGQGGVPKEEGFSVASREAGLKSYWMASSAEEVECGSGARKADAVLGSTSSLPQRGSLRTDR